MVVILIVAPEDAAEEESEQRIANVSKNPVSKNSTENLSSVSGNSRSDTSYSVNKNHNDNFSSTLGRNIRQNSSRNFSSDLDKDFNSTLGPNTRQNSTRNYTSDLNKDFSSTLERNTRQNSSRNYTSDLNEDFSSTLGRNTRQNSSKNFSSDLNSSTLGRDTRQNSSKNFSSDLNSSTLGRDTRQNSTRNFSSHLNKDFSCSIERESSSNINGNFSSKERYSSSNIDESFISSIDKNSFLSKIESDLSRNFERKLNGNLERGFKHKNVDSYTNEQTGSDFRSDLSRTIERNLGRNLNGSSEHDSSREIRKTHRRYIDENSSSCIDSDPKHKIGRNLGKNSNTSLESDSSHIQSNKKYSGNIISNVRSDLGSEFNQNANRNYGSDNMGGNIKRNIESDLNHDVNKNYGSNMGSNIKHNIGSDFSYKTYKNYTSNIGESDLSRNMDREHGRNTRNNEGRNNSDNKNYRYPARSISYVSSSASSSQVNPDSASSTTKEEEWVTKKKVELTTKRQIETRVKRQVVLEDGRVVEDSGPIVTTNTTEDTEKQESTTTEKRDLAGDGDGDANGQNRDKELEWSAPPGTVATQDGLLREVKEKKVCSRQETSELLETEDVQHLGDITDQDYQKAVQCGDADLRQQLDQCREETSRSRRERARQLQLHRWDAARNAAPGRVVRQATKSRKVVDSEDSQRLHALGPDGKLVTETRTTTEHEEIKGEEQPDSRSGSSHCEEDHKESSTQFARTKQQQLVDYYLGHKRIGGEIKYESETFEGDRQGAPLELPLDWDKMSARARRLHQLDRKDALTRRPLDPDQEERTRKHETDRWLDSHFGSVSSDGDDAVQVTKPAATSSFINVTMKSSKSPAPATPPPPNDVITSSHHDVINQLRATSMSPVTQLHRSTTQETSSSMTPNRSNQTSNERYSYSRSHFDRSDLSSPLTPPTPPTTNKDVHESRTWYSTVQRNGHNVSNGHGVSNGHSVSNGHGVTNGHGGHNGRAAMSSEEEAASPSPPVRPRRRRGQDTEKDSSRQLIESERRWRSQHSLVNGMTSSRHDVTTPTSTPPLPYNGYHSPPTPPPLHHSTPYRHQKDERGYSPEIRTSRMDLHREGRGYSPSPNPHNRDERGYSPSPDLRNSRLDIHREGRGYSPSPNHHSREERGYSPSPELRNSRMDLHREGRGYSPSPEVIEVDGGGSGKKKIFQRTRFAAEIPLVKPKPQGDQSTSKGGLGIGRSLRKLVNKLGGKSSKNQADVTSQHTMTSDPRHNMHSQHHSQAPVQRYYLGEDPFNGGSIYGRESEYHAAAPRRRHSNRIASDHSSSHQNGYRSTSTLGRLSKSTSRLASSAEKSNARAGGVHTLPRKLHNGVSWQQQQNYRNETSSSSSRLNSDNRSGSLINVSIVNKPKPTTTTTTFTSTLGPAKPARTYRSSLLRSKSFSANANDNISMSPSGGGGGGGGHSTTLHHSSNPQLNRLLTSSTARLNDDDSALKSPGIVTSISRRGSSNDATSRSDTSREASRNLLVRRLIDRVPQLYDALHGNSANGSGTQFGNTANGSSTQFGSTTKFGNTVNGTTTKFGNETTTRFGNGSTTQFGNTVNGSKFGSTTQLSNGGTTQLGNGQSSVWTSSTTTTVENRRYQTPVDRRGSLSSSGGVVIEVRSGD